MAARYFIRIRGRSAGPYSVDEIRSMVRRGALARIHELSTDGQTWSPAGAFGELFAPTSPPTSPQAAPEEAHDPQPPGRALAETGLRHAEASLSPGEAGLQPQLQEVPERATDLEYADAQQLPPPSASQPPAETPAQETHLYFYSRDGVTYGPVSESLLRDMASAGALRPDDPVWTQRDPVIRAARQLGVLGPILAPSAPAGVQVLPVQEPPIPTAPLATAVAVEAQIGGRDAGPHPPRGHPQSRITSPDLLRRTGKLSLAAGLSVAALLLFCVNVPHQKAGESLLWWWDLFRQPDMGVVVFLCLYGLLAGLGLVFVALLLKGAIRGWVYVSAAAIGLPVLVSAGMSVAGASGVFPGLFAPAFFAALACVSGLRARAPHVQFLGTLQAIGAAMVCLVTLALAVFTTLALARLAPGGEAMPGWLIGGILLSILGYLSGLLGAVLGLVAAFRAPSKPITSTLVLTESGAAALILLTGALVGYGAANLLPVAPPQGRFAFVQVLRLLVTAGALVVLLVTGLLELLTCTVAPSPREGVLEQSARPLGMEQIG